MNVHWFARFAQRLSGEVGRRQTFHLVGGALAAALLNHESAAAGCKKVGKKCDRNKDCCDGARCKGGKNGKCRCKGGFSTCNKKCHDLNQDDRNCGACGNTCLAPNKCCDGECNTTCAQ
jgi:hypothetical protein